MPLGIFDTIGTNVVLRSRCVPCSRQFLRIACGVLWLLPCGLLPGCYDAELLVNQTREQAALVRLEEVEIDEFRVTLPRQRNSTTILAVTIHPFANVAHRDVDEVAAQLDETKFKLRHEVILAIRLATRDELAEPDLARIRDRVSKVVMSVTDAPIHSIGFKKFEVFAQ